MKNKGISLILLVITIVVIIIISATIMISFKNNNVISSAKKAVILNNIATFESELQQYVLTKTLEKSGNYDYTKLDADSSSIVYDGEKISNETIYNILPSLENKTYEEDIIIDDGKIIYIGIDKNMIETLPEEKLDIPIPKVEITRVASDSIYRLDEDIEFSVNITDISDIINVDLSGKVEILDSLEQVIYTDSDEEIIISNATGSSKSKNVNITILSNTLTVEDIYMIKVKSGIAKNDLNLLDEEDKEIVFYIDSIAPEAPAFSLSNSEPTNENVAVTITFPIDAITKEYSIDSGNTWIEYSSSITMTANGTIIARGKDIAGNYSSVSSISVTNIDKTAPIEPTIFVSETALTNSDVVVTINYPLDTAVKEYSIDNGNTWFEYSSSITMTANGTIVARGKDAVGNYSITSSITIANIDKEPPVVTFVNDTSWKNATTMPGDYQTFYSITDNGCSGGKEQYALYSTSSASLSDITNGPFAFTATTHSISSSLNNSYYLHIKAVDNAGNSAIYTSDVYRVDRLYPSGVFTPNSGSYINSTTVEFNSNDTGTSGVDKWKYAISTDGGNTYGTYSSYINGDTSSSIVLNTVGTNKIKVEVYDNAGNVQILYSGNYSILSYNIASADVITTVNSTINGNVPAYNNPVIPVGFKAINTTDANWNSLEWNNGLVIEDSSGNQFVWVPVDGSNVTYAKWCSSGNYSYASTTDDSLPSGVSSELTQITKYGGFYIARFEASNNGGIPASKKNRSVWKYISYSSARSLSAKMYNIDSVKSWLVTGTMWDTTLRWIQNSGKSASNSRTWGNHSNTSGTGTARTTGYSETWKAKNIYDLAGNFWEWNNEKVGSSLVFRSGYYNNRGDSYPAASRLAHSTGTGWADITFRVALFII